MAELDWRAISRRPKREEEKGSKRFAFRPFFVTAMPTDFPPLSGSGFHLGIQIGDHIFERRNGLLYGRNLNQLPARHRALAVL